MNTNNTRTNNNKTIPMRDYGNMVQHTLARYVPMKNKLRKTVAMYSNPYYNIFIIDPVDQLNQSRYDLRTNVRQHEGVHYEQNNN